MPNFNSIGSRVSEPQVAENRYLPLTGGIALTMVYALTCYTVIGLRFDGVIIKTLSNLLLDHSICTTLHSKVAETFE